MATIAELFVNLGIKGADTASKALKGVKSGLGEISSTSLEAKAAIIATIYALERLMSTSAQQGTGLMNFNELTGLSVKQLQEWQYAARQVGVTNDELTGSVKGVQTAMTNMLLGKGAPEGMAMLANKVGFDQTRARDTFYVMEQLQKFAKAAPPDVASNLMKSFGLSEGVIAAMQRQAFRPDVFAKAPQFSGGEIKQLDRVNAAWSNLGTKVQMAMGHFTAMHGMQLVSDISKIADQVFRLVNAFTQLADKLKIFQLLGKSIEGWAMLFGAATKGVDAIGGAVNDPKKRKDLGDNVLSFLKEIPDVIMAMREEYGPKVASPQTPQMQQNINVQQSLNFQHDGKDHVKTADSVKKAINHSYRQMSAQAQGT